MTGQGGTRGDLTQITVNLTPKAAAALEEISHRTHDTRTDIVNVALMLYAQLDHVTVAHPREGTRAFDWPDVKARLAVRTGPQRWWQRW